MRSFFVFLSLFIFIKIFGFSNVKDFYENFLNEKEPSALFDGCVDLINGNLAVQDEIVADGKEPIKIKKSHFSLSNFDLLKREEKDRLEFVLAGFSYKDLTRVLFYGDRVDIVEPSGEVLTFGANLKNHKGNQVAHLNYRSSAYLPKFFHQRNLKKMDASKIRVEARGIYDLVVFYPCGMEKHFRRDNIHINEYYLRTTKLLNQNILHYSYDRFNNLEEIKSTNFSSSKVYAWIRFNYLHPEVNYSEKNKDKYDLNITTSDGKFFNFRFKDYSPFISTNQRAKRPFYILEDIFSNISNEHFDYHLDYKKTHPLLKILKLSDKREKLVDYYLLGNKNPELRVEFFEIDDFRFERVKILKQKTSVGSFANEYRFYYENGILNQRAGKTTVLDSKNNKYIYFYNKDFKIEKIQRFKNLNAQYFLVNEERFFYEKKNNFSVLTSKSFLDENQKILVQIDYFYDSNFNLTEEKILGDISKENEFENFSKRYKYSNDNRNLLIEKTDDAETFIQYFYLPNTNLISAKYLLKDKNIKKRDFYEYNSDFILIKKIQDDGSSLKKDDLSNITFRKIKYIYPIEAGHFLGFKNIEEKKFLDLKNVEEKLFSKKIYSYSLQGKVAKKEFFDSENEKRYTYFYEYDEKSNLLSKTDVLNKKTTYSYDINSNKISKIYPNTLTKLYSYDKANNLVKKQIKKDDVSFEKILKFDEKNNKTYFLDYLGGETFYKYDSFSNLTKITSKKEKTKKSIQKLSYDSFGNISRIVKDNDIAQIKYNVFSKPTLINQNGLKKRFIYNLDGTLKTYIDEKGIKTHFEYDYLKRIVNIKILTQRDQIINEKNYVYNLFSLIEIRDQNFSQKYTYDFCKRLIKDEIFFINDSFDIQHFYDSLSRMHKTIYNNEIVKTKSFDLLNRTIQERVEIKTNPFYEKNFVYDKADNFSLPYYIKSKMQEKKHSLNQPIFNFQKDKTRLNYFDNIDISTNKDQIFYDLITKNLSKLSSINFISAIYKNIVISYGQKQSFIDEDFLDNPNIFSACLLLYDDLDLESIFSENSFCDFNKKNIKILFTKNALLGMQRFDILIKQILEALKMFENIETIDKNEFLISYKNIKMIINIEEKDQFIIKNVNEIK
ncbi:MAG: tRNA nuclease WapA [Candidatus Anoxychlamydiales bacterium]|nr:tRNA nuclease WapA [Candidatus Anoxychlamydiales bacterium]